MELMLDGDASEAADRARQSPGRRAARRGARERAAQPIVERGGEADPGADRRCRGERRQVTQHPPRRARASRACSSRSPGGSSIDATPLCCPRCQGRCPTPLGVFGALLRRDVRVARRELPFFLVRTVMQPVLFLIVFGFLLPRMGFIRGGYTTALLPGHPGGEPDDVVRAVGVAADDAGLRLDARDRGPAAGAGADPTHRDGEGRGGGAAGGHRGDRGSADRPR